MNIGAVSYAKVRIRRIPYYTSSFLKLFFSLSIVSQIQLISDIMGLTKNHRVTFIETGLSISYLTFLDLLVLKEVLLDREYEIPGVALTRKDTVVVDIGAGFGDYAMMMAQKYPWVHVHAFEPSPEYSALFEENKRRNNVRNITLYKKPASSLSDILKVTKVKKIDLLKLDCEGCEFQIFSSGQKKYYKRVRKIAMEYHESKAGKVNHLQNILRKYFRVVRIIPQKHATIGHMFAYNSSFEK